MKSPLFLLLLCLQLGFGQSSKHEDHYIGQQHNPQHDMNVLLGEEVFKYDTFFWIENVWNVFSLLTCSLFLRQDSEEIKKLSPAQQKRKIVEILKEIDTNGDDLLSAGRQTCQRASRPEKKWMRTTLLFCAHTEELTLWIQHVYRTYALDDAKERFPEFDTNQDGFVTWEEYNQVAHDQLISFDDSAVLDDPEQESLRYASILQLSCY